MPATGESDAPTLASLRSRIDAIDAEMHRLLIERSSVIDALIATKGTSLPGAAFRPGREADMMRRLVARHRGALPLATVEHIWREIITTFTHMQAPFALVVDGGADPLAMRDLARFHFGFSVEIVTAADAAAVLARVAATGADLGLVARAQPEGAGAWWRALDAVRGPRIMAALPVIAMPRRPAAMPAFVIAPPLADPAPPDLHLAAARTDAAPEALRRSRLAGAILALAGTAAGTELLLAHETPAGHAAAASAAGFRLHDVRPVGGIWRAIEAPPPHAALLATASAK